MCKRNIDRLVAFHLSPTGALACNPDMRPEGESNQQIFGFQNDAQPTEPHQLGLK